MYILVKIGLRGNMSEIKKKLKKGNRRGKENDLIRKKKKESIFERDQEHKL